MTSTPTLRLYGELATWWPLLSPPSDYVDEAVDLRRDLVPADGEPARTLLELGSGGGSLAWHLKRDLRLTLTDVSESMLAVNRAANPECEHVEGDMRALDLGRTFDLVLVHDAIMYAVNRAELRATLATAFRHCRPGGTAVFVPDEVRETFVPGTSMGGQDGADGRGLRYLEWSWDPDPADDTCEVAWAFLLREPDGAVRVDHDRHTYGLFPRAVWLEEMREVGFVPRTRPDPWGRDVFAGARP